MTAPTFFRKPAAELIAALSRELTAAGGAEARGAARGVRAGTATLPGSLESRKGGAGGRWGGGRATRSGDP